jgi:hypothetical protein
MKKIYRVFCLQKDFLGAFASPQPRFALGKEIPFEGWRWMGFSLLLFVFVLPGQVRAFCGFYVGKADSTLYNKASKVVLVRNEDKTVISLMNDYQGDLKEFALVVPVPQVLQKGQIHIGDPQLFSHLDAYSAPRLVEYFDPDPCQRAVLGVEYSAPMAAGMGYKKKMSPERDQALGVKIEAQYTVGEYDIVILSANQSDGLETWLRESGYHIPKGASRALRPYIKQNMKFFVAKVNLVEQAKTGAQYLRPLQFAFESPKFMLPIRLGMINSRGSQDLIVYVMTKDGRVETTNYRTVKLPTGMDIPEYVKDDFKSFYKSLFDEQVNKEGLGTVFTEYFWNMSWCDPCAAAPLSPEELKSAGVFWVDNSYAPQVMLTRLHIRYSPESTPEDLAFQETKDQENFQARYVLRHAWKGGESCPEAKNYYEQVRQRHETEAETLANLTGWDVDDIRRKMGLEVALAPRDDGWWKKIWN